MSLVHEVMNPILSVECPICLDPVIEQKYITFNECDHKFHIKCLNDWQIQNHSNLIHHYKCPICNKLRDINIEKSLIEPVYTPADRPTTLSLTQKIKRCFIKLIR